MNKNELEFAKAQLSDKKHARYIGLVTHLATLACLVACFYTLIQGIQPILLGQSPDGFSAFAKIVEALSLGSWFSSVWATIASGAWWLERKGKKRAIAEKGKYQEIAERDDEYRSSSGLSKTGDTPK